MYHINIILKSHVIARKERGIKRLVSDNIRLEISMAE